MRSNTGTVALGSVRVFAPEGEDGSGADELQADGEARSARAHSAAGIDYGAAFSTDDGEAPAPAYRRTGPISVPEDEGAEDIGDDQVDETELEDDTVLRVPQSETEIVPDAAPAERAASERPVDAAPAPSGASDPSALPVTNAQPFWALAPEQCEVHDFEGRPIYSIGPTAWALVLEDRGSYFVMRHDDGRIGYLHDTTNITRG